VSGGSSCITGADAQVRAGANPAKRRFDLAFQDDSVIGSNGEGRTAPPRVLHRLAIFVALLSLTALVLGFLGRWLWPFDLLNHFRVHCVALLVLAAGVLLGLKDWKNGIVAALGAALAAIPLFDYLVPQNPASLPSSSEPSLRVLTFNVWFRNEDFARIADYLATSGADIAVLQEISEHQGPALTRGARDVSLRVCRGRERERRNRIFALADRRGATVQLSATG